MNKKWIAVVNIVLMLSIVGFVVLYSSYESRDVYRHQVENFEHTTLTMERVTENYLEGEQRICDVWAHFINARHMTLEQAAAFIRESHVLTNTSAHLLYQDTLTGLSTRANPQSPDSFAVSYANYTLFNDIRWIHNVGEAINVTRAFTNPINGEQSMAFCNRISVTEDGKQRDALLLRVVPVEEMEQKWVFPQEKFESAELSMIDVEGNYIIRGRAFKNTNFFEFYKSYNEADLTRTGELKQKVLGTSGSFLMKDSRNENAIVAHTPILSTDGWVLLSMMSEKNLNVDISDWLLISVVSLGLLTLFILDLLYMQYINKRLQLMARESEAANRAKTDFLSTMSHDIRTPMNAIIGLTTIAEKNLGDPQAVGENLRKISLASSHLLTLINDILDISKVESGKLTLSPLTFSIVETAENLVNISQPMIKEKNIDFSFRINRMEKEYLYADQLRLNQIYINILSNAIKYTQPGGRVSVDLREEESSVPGCVKLCYTVADNGIGMTPAFMEKMYQPFSRQTDSRVNSIQGTGLGLAITKKMVDLMGGTIDCESAPGKGTTFTIIIDIPVADRQREDLKLDELDVLIVDDDPILLQTTSETLESMGAHADCADNGAQALDMIARRHEQGRDYGIVIVDWRMPGMDGVETVRSIRRDINPDIPILLISAYDWSDIEDSARGAGANGFISKPLFRSKLYAKINELLGTEAKSIEPEDDYTDLAGLNILVAEDNDINWEIISAMLGMYGITTERAENGRVCVDKMEAAEEGQYMLIFMDIQMPVMNGLDATRAIRRLPRPWASSIPIIAMTADAFSENVAACMEAGMNGHIAKPIDIKLVIKEIRRIKEETALAASARR